MLYDLCAALNAWLSRVESIVCSLNHSPQFCYTQRTVSSVLTEPHRHSSGNLAENPTYYLTWAPSK